MSFSATDKTASTAGGKGAPPPAAGGDSDSNLAETALVTGGGIAQSLIEALWGGRDAEVVVEGDYYDSTADSALVPPQAAMGNGGFPWGWVIGGVVVVGGGMYLLLRR